mgnify:CR=1 FL=1
MSSKISIIDSELIFDKSFESSLAVVDPLILVLIFLATGPASNYSIIFITLIPVSNSEFMIALCIGAAPRHFGSRDA